VKGDDRMACARRPTVHHRRRLGPGPEVGGIASPVGSAGDNGRIPADTPQRVLAPGMSISSSTASARPFPAGCYVCSRGGAESALI
jgi:hypothetical protein